MREIVFIKRSSLNSAPLIRLITHEAVKGPSARPSNPTPTVFKFSTEISQKYNTTSKEVIIKGRNASLLYASFLYNSMSFNWVDHLHDVSVMFDITSVRIHFVYCFHI